MTILSEKTTRARLLFSSDEERWQSSTKLLGMTPKIFRAGGTGTTRRANCCAANRRRVDLRQIIPSRHNEYNAVMSESRKTGTVEILDAEVARSLRRKTPGERIQMAFESNRLVREPCLYDEIQLTSRNIRLAYGLRVDNFLLSASRYRQVEQDEEFYEQPRVTLKRLRELETAAQSDLAVLQTLLAPSSGKG